MQIIGFIKNSFVDFPTLISSVIFTPGCDLNCWYCHNYDVITKSEGIYQEQSVLEFLEERKNFLDGVVISGGEPTLQKELPGFIKKVKELGLKVKLDTCGTNFDMVKQLIDDKLLDYIAMDIKAPTKHYGKITSIAPAQITNVIKTANLIKSNGVEYELRTTFAPNLKKQDIIDLLEEFAPIATYSLQAYQHPAHIAKSKLIPHNKEIYNEIKEYALEKNLVTNFNIKNLD